MSIDTEFQIINNTSETKFYIGIPMNLIGSRKPQNEIEAELIGVSLEEHYKWMTARGAKEISRNDSGFVLFAFEDKKTARKTARELTKIYLKYRMRKAK